MRQFTKTHNSPKRSTRLVVGWFGHRDFYFQFLSKWVGDALNFRTLFAPFPAPAIRPFNEMQLESLAE